MPQPKPPAIGPIFDPLAKAALSYASRRMGRRVETHVEGALHSAFDAWRQRKSSTEPLEEMTEKEELPKQKIAVLRWKKLFLESEISRKVKVLKKFLQPEDPQNVVEEISE